MTTQLWAYVTTATSMPAAAPGILIQRVEVDGGHVDYRENVLDVAFPAGWGEDTGGGWDYAAIDRALADHGFSRVLGAQWAQGDGQLTAAVERD